MRRLNQALDSMIWRTDRNDKERFCSQAITTRSYISNFSVNSSVYSPVSFSVLRSSTFAFSMLLAIFVQWIFLLQSEKRFVYTFCLLFTSGTRKYMYFINPLYCVTLEQAPTLPRKDWRPVFLNHAICFNFALLPVKLTRTVFLWSLVHWAISSVFKRRIEG